MIYLQSVQSPHWKTVLVVETTKLFISNSVGVYTDTFIDTLSQGWGFWLPLNFVSRWGFLCSRIIPGERFLLPSSRAQGFLGGGGGGGFDEIDTYVCHRYVKSDIARSTSVDQVNHSSLKMCRTFSITKAKQLNLWIKTILSVTISWNRSRRIKQCFLVLKMQYTKMDDRGVMFWERRITCRISNCENITFKNNVSLF